MNKLSISMTREETIMGWLFLSIHLFFLPRFLTAGNALLGQPLSTAMLNFVMFLINFIIAVLIFHRFLRNSLKTAFRVPVRSLLVIAFCLAGYYLSDFLLTFLIHSVSPEFFNINDSAIVAMTRENLIVMAIGTIFLVPLVEESLYRGLIFCSLQQKSRILAYLVSVLGFALIHVINYIDIYQPLQLFFSFLQYLPAGIFLALAYEKTDSIWTPILMHTTVNLVALCRSR